MLNNLFEHPFVVATRERTTPLIMQGFDHLRANPDDTDKAPRENRERIDTADQYEMQVMDRTMNLLNTVEALDNARGLMFVFPEYAAQSASLSQDQWINYHYGYFTISLASVVDVSILLTSTVFQLGIAPRHCRYDIVRAHDRVKGTAVARAIKLLKNAVEEIQARRNLHVHRGEHADIANLTPDGYLQHLKEFTFIQSIDPGRIDVEDIRNLWRDAESMIMPQLDDEVAQAEATVRRVLGELLPEFKRVSDGLRRGRDRS